MLCLEAFFCYCLRWCFFICWGFFVWLFFLIISEGVQRQHKQQWVHRAEFKNQKRLACFPPPPRQIEQQQMYCLAQTPTTTRRHQVRRGKGIFCLLICKSSPAASLFWKETVYILIPHIVSPHKWQSPPLTEACILKMLSQVAWDIATEYKSKKQNQVIYSQKSFTSC